MTVMTQQHGGSFLLEQLTAADIVCPEDMSDEERLLMRSIKEFAEQEVSPLYDEIDRLNIDIIRPLFKKAADLGLFMAEVPENLGGLGLSLLAIAGLSECRCYLGGLSSTVFAHQGIGTLPLINFGTAAQIDRYLNPCMHGDLMAAFALTEPGSGSDAMNITTTAVLNPAKTHYVVNGAKQWITNAGWADLFILFAKVDGLARIRYTTSHPADMDDDLIAAHGDTPKLMPFLHLPVQAGSDRVLKAMNRSHSVESYLKLLDRFRAARPDLALSGDFIVGFPGETDAEFEETLQLVGEVAYAQAFSFKYSPRPGTPAATMDGQVAKEVMDERLQRLQAALNRDQLAFNQNTVGRTCEVLVERKGKLPGQWLGKTPWLQSAWFEGDVQIGDLVQVELVEAGPNSLAGMLRETVAA